MWKDSETDQDLLHFDYLVKTVESIAMDTDLTPSTIGVYGDWGSGKSSLMKMVRKDLESKEGVKCIDINGWLFEGYDDARSSLCGTILDDIYKDEKFSNKVKDELKDLIKKVDYKKILAKGTKYGLDFLLTGGIGTLSELTIEGFVSLLKSKAGNISEDQIKSIIDKASEKESKRHEVKEFSKDFNEILGKTGIKHLIIFIDELDRCQPDTILDIFEAIRLFLFVNGTTFIIGADERLVQYAIKTKYKDIPGTDLDIGKEYLEKLIQYPITIPQLTEEEVSHYITSLLVVKDLNQKDFDKFLSIVQSIGDEEPINYDLIHKENKDLADKCRASISLSDQISYVLAQILNGNPRQCKRFLNTLFMRMHMAEIRQVELSINLMAKLMLVEYFKPQLYGEFFNSGNFKDLKEIESDTPSESNKLKTWTEDKWVTSWLEKDPKLPENYEDLYKYLFYSRDKFRYGKSIVRSLGVKVQKCFDLIMTESKTNIKEALELSQDFSPAEIAGLVKALFTQLNREDKLNINIAEVALVLNKNHGMSDDSVNILTAIPLTKISPALIPHIIENTKDSQSQERLLKYLSEDKKLEKSIKEFNSLNRLGN